MKAVSEKTPELTPFERFQRLIRGLAAVPKKEIEAEEAKWRADRLLKKKSPKV
jgi:hypothetical protein